MGLSTRLAKSTPPQIPSHAIHPNSRHLFGIRQHREFYSAQDFKTDQEPLLDSFKSKPHSFYPIRAYHSEYWTLSDAAGGANVSLSAISFPGWVNKRLKIGASFPGFYLTFLTPRLARLSLLTPRLTLARASQQNTCLFHPTDGESHPSRLRASISSLVTASASRPPNFTFPSSPVRQRVLNLPSDAGESLPARQALPFPPPGRLTFPSLPIWHSEPGPPVGCRREPSG